MNARNASGNTPLHVCAVNSQESCMRLLLFRGADKEALNFANQTPYQVAVIAGNLELAETIQKHSNEQIVPFREPPRYNPKRRPSSVFLLRSGSDPRLDLHTSLSTTLLHHHSLPPSSASSHALLSSMASSPPPQGKPPLPPSPSPSDRSIPPFSSACSSLSEASSSSGQHRGSEAGDSSEASASIVTDKSLLDQCDIISDSSGVGTSNSGGSAGSGGYDTGAGLLLAGVTAVCVENYSSNTSGHIGLTQGDIVEVTGATDCGMLEGTNRGRSGIFPAHCVQEVRLRQGNSATLRVQGRRETNMKHFATAPRLKKPLTAEPRTVVLHRSRKGFGFVLRGAKATSPLMELTPSERCPALQYLDDVDTGGVADVAGLRKGDYLLEINGEDVSQASHEHVVELIRRSGDLVAMRVVSLGEGGANPAKAASTLPSRQCATLPRKGTPQNRNPAPLPPRRDPKTTLSVGRARARSLVAELGALSYADGGHQQQRDMDDIDSEEPSLSANTTKSSSTESVQARGTPPRTASIRARPTSSRITAAELEELFARQGPAPPSPAGSTTPRTPRVYASVAEMKRSRGKRHRGGVLDSIHKAFSSTPDLAHFSPSHAGARTWSARSARSQEDISWWSQPTQTSGHIGTTSLMNGTREYSHAWRSMERLHTEHEAVTRSLSQRTRSLPRNRSSGPPPPPTHPPPPPPVGQVVRVEVAPRGKGSGSDYANVRELPAGQAAQQDARNGRGTPTSPEPVMSSFRPGPAKLYACPEEVKPVAYRAGKGTLPRREGKGRSHSLPPSGARPQVRKHSKGDGGNSPGVSSPGYSSFKPPEAAPASPLPGGPPSPSPAASESNSHNPYAQPFQHSASGTPTTVAAPPIPEPDYSMSEESEDGEEVAKVQSRRSSSRKNSETRGSSSTIVAEGGPLSPVTGARSSPNGPLSPSAARSSPMSPVFKDLLAQKVAERQTRINGAGTPADENPPSSPSLGSQDKTEASSSSAEPSSNGGGLSHSFSVEEIQKVKTQLKSSKSYPNDFSQEDGDNSSSGVSSDQDTQPEPAHAATAECQASPPKLASQSPAPPPAQSTRPPVQPGRVATLQSPSQPLGPRLPGQGAVSQRMQHQATSAFNKAESSERSWQPDGKESSPNDLPPPDVSKVRRKSEEISRRTGTLTRHAVSLVQLPPPQEADGEVESTTPVNSPAPTHTSTLPHRPTKSVTFMTQEKPSERQREIEREQRAHERAMERERERIERERERERQLERERREMQGPIQATKLIMPNHRQPIPSAHLRQSVPSQRSRSTDVDTGRPVEVERSIEESLQLIQRHVEQLSLVVPPPPEFDGARMAAAAAAAAHAHHYHHHHPHHPGAMMAGHPMHASYPGPPQLPPNLQPTLPQTRAGHPPHPGAFPVGHPCHPEYQARPQTPQAANATAAAAGRAPHHPHLYHLHPPPDEPVLVAPPPEFSDTGEPHKMTIRVGASSPGTATLQRMTPAQQAEIMRQRQLEEMARQRHIEEINRQRAEVIRQQQLQQQQKTVRIVGTLPKKAPSK